jgi:hypothetical protein
VKQSRLDLFTDAIWRQLAVEPKSHPSLLEPFGRFMQHTRDGVEVFDASLADSPVHHCAVA